MNRDQRQDLTEKLLEGGDRMEFEDVHKIVKDGSSGSDEIAFQPHED